MKTFFPALLIVFVAGSLALAEPPRRVGEAGDPPKDGFESLDALKQWAGSSSFGGGYATTYRLGDREVHVVNRCFTSGVATTELSFYVQRPGTSRLACVLFQPMREVEVRCKLQDQTLVFEQYDDNKRKWVVAMTFTESFFRP